MHPYSLSVQSELQALKREEGNEARKRSTREGEDGNQARERSTSEIGYVQGNGEERDSGARESSTRKRRTLVRVRGARGRGGKDGSGAREKSTRKREIG